MRRLAGIVMLLLVALACLPARAEDHLYAYRDSVKNGYNFLLYVPESYQDTTQALPIILNLHGKSLAGNNLNTITRYGCIDALRRGRQINALVICPQCNTTGGWEAERLMRVVNWVMSRYRHDPDRLYCFGISMGGWGTFKFASVFPDRVAAAIAMCGGYTGEVEPLGRLPLWIIHGTSDPVTNLSYSTSIVEKLAKIDRTEHLFFTWLTGCDHSILARVFLLQEPYDWLFSHTLKDEGRPVNREIVIEPKDLQAAYMRIDQSHAQRLPIVNPPK
ncbi:MAG: phospholipase [Bacteroidales bacterium]|nr:phospholipase [Bacteroidales bacterium]